MRAPANDIEKNLEAPLAEMREIAAEWDTPFPDIRVAVRTGDTIPRERQSGLRIGAHHGSMSRTFRLEMEDDLKTGRLRVIVATSSLELGIDIGHLDLVCQVESPKNVAAGLQRIGPTAAPRGG